MLLNNASNETALYSIFKSDISCFQFQVMVDISKAMQALRRTSMARLKEETTQDLHKMDIFSLIYLQGFEPLHNLLAELEEEFGSECDIQISCVAQDKYSLGFVTTKAPLQDSVLDSMDKLLLLK
jgi:hypothetical protein